jgi:hypothetical protein
MLIASLGPDFAELLAVWNDEWPVQAANGPFALSGLGRASDHFMVMSVP